jgi:hypothetical protein
MRRGSCTSLSDCLVRTKFSNLKRASGQRESISGRATGFNEQPWRDENVHDDPPTNAQSDFLSLVGY